MTIFFAFLIFIAVVAGVSLALSALQVFVRDLIFGFNSKRQSLDGS